MIENRETNFGSKPLFPDSFRKMLEGSILDPMDCDLLELYRRPRSSENRMTFL